MHMPEIVAACWWVSRKKFHIEMSLKSVCPLTSVGRVLYKVAPAVKAKGSLAMGSSTSLRENMQM